MNNQFVNRMRHAVVFLTVACAGLLLPTATPLAEAQANWNPQSSSVTLGEQPVVSELTAGGEHVYMRTAEGRVWVWGDNSSGQLGVSTPPYDPDATVPKTIENDVIGTIVDVSAGLNHGLAVNSNHDVFAWGENSYGQLGSGNYYEQAYPGRVYFPDYSTLTGVQAVAAGGKHSLALSLDGVTIWSWGDNDYGQLGTGTSSGAEVNPVTVSLPHGTVITAIAAGYKHSLALDSSGYVWAWGADTEGQLGRDGTGLNPTPKKVVDAAGNPLSGIKAIYSHPASYSSYAISEAGAVYAWGRNSSGQLGTGDDTSLYVATPNGQTDIQALAPGIDHALALRNDGAVLSWGNNDYDQLGRPTGSDVERFSPTPIAGLEASVKAIGAGSGFSFAVKQDDSIWGWGANSSGQLANMGYEGLTSPQNPATLDLRPIVGMDEQLKEEIIDDLWGDSSRELVVGEMLKLNTLWLENSFLEKLNGLEYARNLNQLTVNYTRIRDLSPIGSLTKLISLDLADNNLEFVSLEPLGNLSELETLNLNGTNVHDHSDLSVLTNLTKLTELYLDDNLLETVPQLPESLNELTINNNRLRDISNLVSLINLSALYINDNELESIEALEYMTNLNNLEIVGNRFTDLTPLKINAQKQDRAYFDSLDISDNFISASDPLIDQIRPYISSFYNSSYYRMVHIQVTDTTGQFMEGATVQVTREYPDQDTFTTMSGTTDADGRVEFTIDDRGVYSFTVNAAGMISSTQSLDLKRYTYNKLYFTMLTVASEANAVSYFIEGDKVSNYYSAVATFMEGAQRRSVYTNVATERRPNGVMVRLPNLDWTDPNRVYDISLFGQGALLQTAAAYSDRGEPAKALSLPSLTLAIDIQSAGPFYDGVSATLAVLNSSGEATAIGTVGDRARISEGTYHVQVLGYAENDIHFMERANWHASAASVSNAAARLTFVPEEVSAVQANLNWDIEHGNGSGYEEEEETEGELLTETLLDWKGMTIHSSMMDHNPGFEGMSMGTLYMSKATYPSLGFYFEATELQFEQGSELGDVMNRSGYEFAVQPAHITSPEHTVTFSTYMYAEISPRSMYMPGEWLAPSDLAVKDKYQHTVTRVTYYQFGEEEYDYEYFDVTGKVTFEGPQFYIEEVHLDHPRVQIPTVPGTYTMTFSIDGGVLPIHPAVRTIEVLGSGEPGQGNFVLEMRRADTRAIRIGDTFSTVVEAVYSDGTRQPVTNQASFSFNSEALAMDHSASGQFTALKSGSHVIEVYYQGVASSMQVEVMNGAQLIVMSTEEGAAIAGKSFDLRVLEMYDDGSSVDVTAQATFESGTSAVTADPSVNGRFTVTHPGSYTIQVHYQGAFAVHNFEVLSPSGWLVQDYYSHSNQAMDLPDFITYLKNNWDRIDWTVIRKEQLSDMLKQIPAKMIQPPLVH
jgi:alpha-tubulin suppressor-like RCC1 family protein